MAVDRALGQVIRASAAEVGAVGLKKRKMFKNYKGLYAS